MFFRRYTKIEHTCDLGIVFLLNVLVSCSVPSGKNLGGEQNRQTVLTGIAPGVIRVDVLEDGAPANYWQYAMTPQLGMVQETSSETFSDSQHMRIPETFQLPTGAIDGCSEKPHAISPNGKYQARCEHIFEKTQEFSGIYHDIFSIEDVSAKTELFHWRMEPERFIRGFSWSSDSTAVSLLNTRQNYVVGKFLGHMAIPHDSVYVDVISPSAQFTEYTVRSDVPYAFTRILDWSIR